MARITLAILFLLFVAACRQGRGRYYARNLSTSNFSDKEAWNRTVRKYGTDFNRYRRMNGLPQLPDAFYISNYGGDYVEWTNPETSYPCYWQKSITWFNDENTQTIITENNLIKGRNGEMLRFFYIRHKSDSVILNYQSLPEQDKSEIDSCYLRSYKLYKHEGMSKLTKNQYDSVLASWGVKLL